MVSVRNVFFFLLQNADWIWQYIHFPDIFRSVQKWGNSKVE